MQAINVASFEGQKRQWCQMCELTLKQRVTVEKLKCKFVSFRLEKTLKSHSQSCCETAVISNHKCVSCLQTLLLIHYLVLVMN